MAIDPEVDTPQHYQQSGVLVRRAPRDVILQPVLDVPLAKQRLAELQAFCADYLQESKDGGEDGGDYGIIPGTKRRTLLKSGAEKLSDVFGLAPRYVITSKIEDWTLGLFDFTLQCELYRKTDEMFVGAGLGSCSSWESKYRWRMAQRTCPECQQPTIIKGKAEFGGGYICWKTKGGCGAKFLDDAPVIVNQVLGRVENPDLIDSKNTVLKMAKKRAFVDAIISVTRASGIFTQDLDDIVHGDGAEAHAAALAGQHVPAESSSATSTQTAPVSSEPAKPETHAEKIARIKREAAEKGVGASTASTAAPAPAAKAPAPAEAPAPAVAPPPKPPKVATPPAALVESTDGTAKITGINVRNGPMVMKDGKSVPSWGPIFVIGFSAKIKATDDTWVGDATTKDVDLAKMAEDARDADLLVAPLVEPAGKKGSYTLTAFQT